MKTQEQISNEVHKVFRWIDAEMEEAKDDDGGIEWDTQIEIYEEALVEIGKIVRNENN